VACPSRLVAAGGMELRVRIGGPHILSMATANISPCLPLAFCAVDDDDTSFAIWRRIIDASADSPK
jgi:hypothetical protein